jgi:hypothetical protein
MADHDRRVVGMITRRDLPRVFPVPDWVVAGEINAKVLHATFNVPADAVRVEMRDGVTWLSGRVPWHSTADEIAEGYADWTAVLGHETVLFAAGLETESVQVAAEELFRDEPLAVLPHPLT